MPDAASPAGDFDARYGALTPRSAELHRRASAVLPGGVGSTARGPWVGWRPYPPAIARGEGAHVWDADGREYVDYLLGLGPMLLGHRHPAVTAAVTEAVSELGTVFGLPHVLEERAARKVVDAVPGVELVRFANSGSEAVGIAVRLARAFTGRPLIVRFEGHYHGWQDAVYWSNHPEPSRAGPADRPVPVPAGPGVPAALADSLEVLSWNDAAAVERVMHERGGEVAALITEPVMLNTGCILPKPGYLEALRRLTREAGSLLIFDEVITGFRVALGGAQELYGVIPDLTTMAKGLGGGFPVAAVGGRRDVMDMIADGRYSHSGTYSSNIIATAAVCAALDCLSAPGTYEALRRIGGRLMAGLAEAAREARLPVLVQGLPAAFQIWFSRRPIDNWRDAERWARPVVFRRFWQEMMLRGILFHPNQWENLFVSTAHTVEDVDRTLQAASAAFTALARDPEVQALLATDDHG